MTAIAALSLVAGLLVGFTSPAAAVIAGGGRDASYFGESAFLNVTAGQSGQFAVGFNNTGSIGWLKGSPNQVDLQICLADKVTCGVASPNAAWAVNWLSSTAYATTTTDYVGPGQTGWFVYNVMAPSNSQGTTARFNGDLALHNTNQQIHPQGYFQDASVAGTQPPAGGGGGSAVPSAISTVTAANLREITVKYNQPMAQVGADSAFDHFHYGLSGGLQIDSARTSDGQTVILTVGTATTGADVHDGSHMSGAANTFMSQNGTYTLTVHDVATAGFALTGTSTTTFTVNDSTSPTANAPTILGAYSFYVTFSEPMDPSSVDNGIFFDSQKLCGTVTPATGTTPDCNAGPEVGGTSNQGGIANLHWQDRTFDDCGTGSLNGGCFQVLRVDFLQTAKPAAGNHTLDIRDATDAANNKLSPNPTTFTVNLPGSADTTVPTISSANISLAGNLFRLDVTFSEAMSHSRNQYSVANSIDTATNYIVRNPDGSPATTGGSNGSGALITLSVQPGTTSDNQQSTVSSARFQMKRARLVLSPVGPDNGQGATTTPTLRPNTQYTLEVLNVQDEAGNALAPGTIKSFSWAGDSTAPQALRAYVTTNQLGVDFSELIISSTGFNPAAGSAAAQGCTNACDRARYTSPNSTFNAWLGSMITPNPGVTSGVTAVGFDSASVNFTNATPLTTGSYELDISGIVDPFGNIITPNPTILQITVGATTKPKLTGAGAAVTGIATTASQVAVKFNVQMTGGVTATNSAGNPSNYSVDNGTFGSLCSAGSPTIVAGPVAGDGSQVWTITCSGTGVWSAGGTHTVTVANVQDLSSNTIDPNPSTAAFTNP